MSKVRLMDIASFSKGSQINGDDLIDNGEYDYLNGGISPSGKWNEYNVSGNSITISEGGNSCGYVNYMSNPFWCGAHCYYLYDLKCNTRYLFYALKSQQDKIMKLRSGACMPNIKKSYIGTFEFEYSDNVVLQEQIVATLDKVTHTIDLCNAILEKLDLLVKSRFVEMFGDPIDNPMGWEVKTLKELSTLITNGNTPKGGSENYVGEGIIFLRSQNVWRNRIDLSDVAYIDEDTHNKMKKSIVNHKDILITKTGRINTENSSLGRSALYLGEDGSANINGHVYLVRLNGTVVPEYVVTILTGEAYRKYIRKICVGGIDKRQINLDQVEEFPIILTPKAMQQQFAAFVEQTDKSKFYTGKIRKIIRSVKNNEQLCVFTDKTCLSAICTGDC